MTYRVEAPFEPAGDQPRAIAQVVEAFQRGERDVTLLGVTGSGKTFTMSKVIEALGMPALILTHNKTLSAQLYEEFRGFFPHDPVGYFVSYYDYYQPEAYIPQIDKYIEKDAKINAEITRLRHHATRALLTSSQAVVVASVSAIYGLGSPEDYRASILKAEVGQTTPPSDLARSLVAMGYEHVADPIDPGTFHRRGGLMDIYPSDTERIVRVEWFGNQIDAITHYEPISRNKTKEATQAHFFPASHYVIDPDTLRNGVARIKRELHHHLAHLKSQDLLLEAQRLEQRANYDLESIQAFGTVKGIENYSRHFQGREEGEPPPCLVDYFPRPFLTIVDESHVTCPQVRGMLLGDRSRKETLIEHGFRLPSALDNRPLSFQEWRQRSQQTLFVSATPADFEREASTTTIEQIIRPTYLVDPRIEVRPSEGQMEDLTAEIQAAINSQERTLVICLTQKMAEEISDWLIARRIRSSWLHAEVKTLDRVKILHKLRKGQVDVVVGINLLREGLDLPEVGLVAILDADRQGYLRSTTALIQIIGRAARHESGRVIMYSDHISPSMEEAIAETQRRRALQATYNRENDKTPVGVTREPKLAHLLVVGEEDILESRDPALAKAAMERLEAEMLTAADRLEFELAATLRDRLMALAEEAAGWVR